MTTTDEVVAALKEWLTVGSPGLVRREDLARLEERLDELDRLVEAIAARLTAPPRPQRQR